ncbi:retrovirus-related pol polyprotein from transposon TNT 1-94 [Tanacetum coccineum]
MIGSRRATICISVFGDMMESSPICLLIKRPQKTKLWLWHRRLSQSEIWCNQPFGLGHGLVQGLPKQKFEKDHCVSACVMGKSKKKPHKPKSEDTNQEKLYLLHMDLCGPMRVASVNGKKYILVIVDDYSRFTWVKCLRSKDEALDFILSFLKMIQADRQSEAVATHDYNKTVPSYVFVTAKYHMSFYMINFLTYRSSMYLVHSAISQMIVRTWCIIKKIHVDFDELTAMAFEHNSSGPALHDMTPATIQFRATHTKTILPQHHLDHRSRKDNHDLDVAHMNNDPFFGITIPEKGSKASSSDVISTVVQTAAPNSEHVTKWTKDHPLDNIIVEPKNYKDALTQACLIEAMKEELLEFDRLDASFEFSSLYAALMNMIITNVMFKDGIPETALLPRKKVMKRKVTGTSLWKWQGRSSQDLEVQVKMKMEIPHSSEVYFITACSYLTDTSNDLMKAQVYVSKLPQLCMPVQLSQAQDDERPQVDDQRLDLADDLKEAQVHISSSITSHKTKVTTSMYKISHEESKTTS